MPELYCEECYDSPKATMGIDPSADVHCRVVGTWNKYDAYDTLMAWLGMNRLYENDCPIDTITLEPVEGAAVWEANIHYSMKKRQEGESFDYQFSTTGGTSHFTRSFRTVTSRSCIAGMPVINFNNGIGYDDGKFEGVDIETPSFTWSQSACWSLDFVDIYYKKLLARFTKCINASPFAGFDVGEVRFDGITNGAIVCETDENTRQNRYYYKLTYSFSAMPNAIGIEVGDSGPFNKYGWDYMWVARAKVDDQTTKNSIMVPRQVNVEQVYPYVELAALCLDWSLWNGIVNSRR